MFYSITPTFKRTSFVVKTNQALSEQSWAAVTEMRGCKLEVLVCRADTSSSSLQTSNLPLVLKWASRAFSHGGRLVVD